MNVKKNETKAMSLTVTDGLTVTIRPDLNHEFLMSTTEVAHAYGTSKYAIRQLKLRHSSELIETKHLLSSVTICHGASSGSSKSTMWTKRGIIRLGFFIKSERAKLFRDWAEELVLSKLEQPTLFDVKPINALPERRNYYNNRLTHERLLDIMAEVCKVEDKEVRMNLTAKLMGGHQA